MFGKLIGSLFIVSSLLIGASSSEILPSIADNSSIVDICGCAPSGVNCIYPSCYNVPIDTCFSQKDACSGETLKDRYAKVTLNRDDNSINFIDYSFDPTCSEKSLMLSISKIYCDVDGTGTACTKLMSKYGIEVICSFTPEKKHEEYKMSLLEIVGITIVSIILCVVGSVFVIIVTLTGGWTMRRFIWYQSV